MHTGQTLQKTARPASKRSTNANTIVPSAQVESFVYGSIESDAERRIETAPRASVQEEVHPGIYAAFIGCWAVLFGVIALTFWGSAHAMLMVAVSVFTGIMYFALPIVMSRQTKSKRLDLPFADFLRGKFDTLTGTVTGYDVLIQVVLVPAALSLGAVAIGFIIHASKIAY